MQHLNICQQQDVPVQVLKFAVPTYLSAQHAHNSKDTGRQQIPQTRPQGLEDCTSSSPCSSA
eukprot:scaffold301413_cov18-Tisochrysis_lutea.AAC.4